jgi:ATP-dependent Clp protease ATP-binding subunit ClpA
VEQAFRIIARLRTAHQRQKALVDVLTRHENELRGVKTLIGILDDEEELHTPSVAEELVHLQAVQGKLTKMLATLDPKQRSKVNQFTRQLVQGSADEKKLATIMDELVHIKATLLLRIQVSSVGVMRNIEQELVANAEVIQRIDQSLREHINDCEGLRIAQLLKGRRPSSKFPTSVILLTGC